MKLKLLSIIILSSLWGGSLVAVSHSGKTNSNTGQHTPPPAGTEPGKSNLKHPGMQSGELKPPKSTTFSDGSATDTGNETTDSNATDNSSWLTQKLTPTENTALAKLLKDALPYSSPHDEKALKSYRNAMNVAAKASDENDIGLSNMGAVSALSLVAESPTGYQQGVNQALLEMSPEESSALETLLRRTFSKDNLATVMGDIGKQRQGLSAQLDPLYQERRTTKSALKNKLSSIEELTSTLDRSIERIKNEDPALTNKLRSFSEEMKTYVKNADTTSDDNKYQRSSIRSFDLGNTVSLLENELRTSPLHDLAPYETANIKNLLGNFESSTHSVYESMIDLGKIKVKMSPLTSQDDALRELYNNKLAITHENFELISGLSKSMMNINSEILKDPSKKSELEKIQDYNKKLVSLDLSLAKTSINNQAAQTDNGKKYNKFIKTLHIAIDGSGIGSSQDYNQNDLDIMSAQLSSLVSDLNMISQAITKKESPPKGIYDKVRRALGDFADAIRNKFGRETKSSQFDRNILSRLTELENDDLFKGQDSHNNNTNTEPKTSPDVSPPIGERLHHETRPETTSTDHPERGTVPPATRDIKEPHTSPPPPIEDRE